MMKSRLFYILYSCVLLMMLSGTVSCADSDLDSVSDDGSIQIIVKENPMSVSCNALDYVFVVRSKCKAWTCTTDNFWIELRDSMFSDSLCSVTFSVDENDERFARMGRIKVANAAAPSVYATLKVRQAGTLSNSNATMTHSMERQHRLGWGYDIMGTYMNDSSFSQAPILNYGMVEAAEIDGNTTIITENRRFYEELETVTGVTQTELQSKLTKSSDSGGSFLGCGKTTHEESTLLKTKSIDEECGIVRLKQVETSRTIDMGMLYTQDLDYSSKSSLLSDEFKASLDSIMSLPDDASRLQQALKTIQRFGTHLVVSADLGGVIDLYTTVTRMTSIDTDNTVKTVAKKIFGKKRSSTSSVLDNLQSTNEDIDYHAEIKCYGGSDAEKTAILSKINNGKITGEITDDEILSWQNSFNIDAAKDGGQYTAALVDCRLLPIYKLIKNQSLRSIIQKAYDEYTGTTTKNSDEQPNGKIDMSSVIRNWQDEDGNDDNCYVQTVTVEGDNGKEMTAIVCKEYVPCLYGDRQCVVAYPLVDGKPFLYCGFFPGDKNHRPGAIRWAGNEPVYEPNDSVCMDDARYSSLFDKDTGTLKTLYLYWNGVQALPKDYSSMYYPVTLERAVANVSSMTGTSGSIVPLVKIGRYFWADHSLQMAQKYSWSAEKGFDCTGGRISMSNGDNYYNLCSCHPRYIELGFSKSLLPSASQAQSVMRVLGGRGALMAKIYKKDYNVLGLKWGKGFMSICNTGSTSNPVYDCDTEAWLVLTTDGLDNVQVTRLSGAGNAVTYPSYNYFSAHSNADQRFFKYLPLYFCTSTIK